MTNHMEGRRTFQKVQTGIREEDGNTMGGVFGNIQRKEYKRVFVIRTSTSRQEKEMKIEKRNES